MMGQLSMRSLLLLTLACASACTLSPRQEQIITNRTQSYSGYHALPNDRISIQAFNRDNGTWKEVASTFSSSTPAHTDSCNYTWYPWQKNVTLPANSAVGNAYWQPTFGDSFIQTRIVASSGSLLNPFPKDADACMAKYQCANDIINNCSSTIGQLLLFCARTECR